MEASIHFCPALVARESPPETSRVVDLFFFSVAYSALEKLAWLSVVLFSPETHRKLVGMIPARTNQDLLSVAAPQQVDFDRCN